MTDFPSYDLDTAPQAAKPFLEKSQKAFGRLPGLHKVMAGAPGLLDVYQQAHAAFQNSSLDKDELTVVWQAINVEHGCHYCVPAHTGIANMMGVDPALSEALRNEAPLGNDALEALRTFTLAMVRQRGEVSEAQLAAFYAAGYGPQQVLEVILGISQKVMSNYVNHIAQTPVDEVMQKFAWEKKSDQAA
ncbi:MULTISPECIES: carboxymuconolactone decarboxylase family protein [unclassified Meridianimarinicoccus]|uniref:carboxymuconolactone decarboxylase family protein n=1 Tax=unclassified Meridianimarinicoccus TaxID=2923344 RepID=UPI001868B471|nr:carboxymuconolactone decarboxylase family protein [Fluviibacterium sp. MJW13]